MIVYVKYNAETRDWSYYYEDSGGFKTTVSPFPNHIKAREHATKRFKGVDLIIKYK